LGDLIARLRLEGPKIWKQLSLLQKGSLIAVVIATIVAIVFLMDWSQRTEYSALFTQLSESDASAIVAELKETNVPYQLADGGSTIRVPSDRVYEVRLQLASQGLPARGSVGFELFDKMSFGLTDFAQRLNFQRALEGELSRTVSSLAGVEEARVHIVLPQSELFVEEEKPVTASVVVKLKPGAELDRRQVRGVVNLVARSVEGLKADNVTVVDGNGIVLSGDDDSSILSAGRAGLQAEVQKSYERLLQNDIQAMLEQVLGPRKAVVRVSAAFDWDQYESSSETFSPGGAPGQVRSAKEITERSNSPLLDNYSGVPTYPLGGNSPAGPTSPDETQEESGEEETSPDDEANTTATATAKADDWKYERREATTNYEISRLVEKTTKTPGEIKKLSVAVLLDGQLDEAVIATVTKCVTAAAGLDVSRGDTVVVESLPFDQSATTARELADEEAAKREMYMVIARGALAVISILVVLLLVRSLIKGLTRDPNQVKKPKGAALAQQQAQQQLAPAAAVPIKLPPTEEEVRRIEVQREMTKLAGTEPKLVAQIVKSWLDER
jgi:flagellar M-ring protein FliF